MKIRHGVPPRWLGSVMRRLPPGAPGKARLARALLRGRSLSGDCLVTAMDHTRFLVPNILDSIGFHLYIDGVYEREEMEWILDRLNPGDVFVDVGANIGVFTVRAAQRVGPTGRVIAIEPSPRIFRYLTDNVELNSLQNVTVCQIAIDHVSAEHVPFYEPPPERFGTGALTPAYGGAAVAVRARRLDELLLDLGVSTVKVLKVDVEGFEQRVFRGTESILRGPYRPDIVFEFYDWAEAKSGRPGDAQRLLTEWGYRVWTIEAFCAGQNPLPAALTSGGGNLVALPQTTSGIVFDR